MFGPHKRGETTRRRPPKSGIGRCTVRLFWTGERARQSLAASVFRDHSQRTEWRGGLKGLAAVSDDEARAKGRREKTTRKRN